MIVSYTKPLTVLIGKTASKIRLQSGRLLLLRNTASLTMTCPDDVHPGLELAPQDWRKESADEQQKTALAIITQGLMAGSGDRFMRPVEPSRVLDLSQIDEDIYADALGRQIRTC